MYYLFVLFEIQSMSKENSQTDLLLYLVFIQLYLVREGNKSTF